MWLQLFIRFIIARQYFLGTNDGRGMHLYLVTLAVVQNYADVNE